MKAYTVTDNTGVCEYSIVVYAENPHQARMMAMSYGYVYVAQVAMGADMNQTIKAIQEAESYDGPSLIIAYSPCVSHGLKEGMGNSVAQEKNAVETGYWHLYRFNPLLKEKGENP
jgi:pyruvate-ferredoxin/flavodoxin oxidoreductase